METLDAGGQRIAYRTSPGSGPAVVFVHGNSSSSAAWARVLDGAFGQRFRVLALDLPGHGESARAKDPAAYSIPGYARVVADFAEAAGAGDAVLVGWSLGGHIALSASTRLPGVRGIVVHGTPPVASPADLATAFLPNPAVATGFTGEVSREDATAYARAQLALGSPCRSTRRSPTSSPPTPRRARRSAAACRASRTPTSARSSPAPACRWRSCTAPRSSW
ncbi:alpha/beta fold hydrolase [Amycolatopsis sp. NPDC051372]|uniref:alpha/beta fold hydrolase n=1 Tax=Amycolatopsis sp. NPDC051372 TaxID=3155669 RepID=UPI00341B4D8F